jgi:hypothetical protein
MAVFNLPGWLLDKKRWVLIINRKKVDRGTSHIVTTTPGYIVKYQYGLQAGGVFYFFLQMMDGAFRNILV